MANGIPKRTAFHPSIVVALWWGWSLSRREVMAGGREVGAVSVRKAGTLIPD
jgi:hypothetical protein